MLLQQIPLWQKVSPCRTLEHMSVNCTYPIDIVQGPGPLLDLHPVPDPEALAASAVALTNTDGGVIVIGVDSSGTYTGPVSGAAVARARRAAANLCNPRVSLDRYELLPTPDGPAVAIRVERGAQVHALQDGRVLVRSGGQNRVLDGDEIRHLITARANGDFEADVIPGARPSDLDPQWVSDFMVHYVAHWEVAPTCNANDLLLHLGMITPEGGITVAGMLLFGLEPQRWLPQSTARFVRYVDRAGSQIAIERALGGPAVRLIDELWAAIRDQMRTPAVPSTVPSTVPADSPADSPDYPREAVREALVNALSHRDYRLRDRHISVSMYPDRLEITSPGGLPGFMTMKHLIGGRYSRNPRLCWGLHLWGYADVPGSGVFSMLMDLDRHGHRPPEIVDGPYYVTVKLYRAGELDPEALVDANAAPLNECQRATLAYIREHGSITLREMRTLCAAATPDQLQRDLAGLVEAGYLRKMGSRSRAYYILA